jgi:release factor H-coupled RctB family protein
MDLEKIKVFASDKNWVEGKALSQLESTAKLPGMLQAVGMPDIHPSKRIH